MFSALGLPENTVWREAVVSQANGVPFQVEVTGLDPSSVQLFNEEMDEFLEATKDLSDSPGKERVIEHLRKTRFVVSNKIPTAFGTKDYDALGEFCEYIAAKCKGLIQADGEGFYEGKYLILPLK